MIKLNKQSKLYAAVLALALGALVIDRLFLGGQALSPRSAMADALDSGTLAVTLSTAGDPPSVAPSHRTLARSLDALRRQSISQILLLNDGGACNPMMFGSVGEWKRRLVRDTYPTERARDALFGGEVAWLGPPRDAEPEPAPIPDTPAPTLDDILARHRFTAVVESKAHAADSFVVVDGERVGIGRTFDGVTVVRIKGGTATFARHDERREVDFKKHHTDQ